MTKGEIAMPINLCHLISMGETHIIHNQLRYSVPLKKKVYETAVIILLVHPVFPAMWGSLMPGAFCFPDHKITVHVTHFHD